MMRAMSTPHAEPKIVVFGIPNCDTVRRARKWLTEQGAPHQFHDFRQDGLDANRIQTWLQQLDWQQVLNRRGTTWRGLSDAERETAGDAPGAAALMARHPALVKRPEVQWPEGRLTLGFDASDWAQRLAAA